MTESTSLLSRGFRNAKNSIPNFDWWLPASIAVWQLAPVLIAVSTVNAESLIYSWSIGGVIWTAWFVGYRKKTGWRRLARHLAFNYIPKADEGNIESLPFLALWREDNVGWMGPLLGGRWEGIETLIFHWRCGVMEGIDSGTTVTMLAMISKRLPTFCLKPRAWDQGAMELVEPWERAWNETFRKNYRVEGAMAEDLRMCFSSRVMSYFAQHPTWTVESCDGWLALYRVGQRLEPWQVEDRLNKAVEILRLFVDNAPDDPKSAEIRAHDRG